MIVRTMTKEDVASVLALEKECFSSPWSEQNLIEETENPTAMFLVAEEEGKIVGYVGSNNISGEVFITDIAVTNNSRRMGVASALLECLIERCINKKALYLTLEVRKSNIAAIKLYSKFGFECVGERKDFYSSPTENALIYTLDFIYD